MCGPDLTQILHPLRRYRDKAGLRLCDIAARAGTSESNLSRIEAGLVALPNFALLERIAGATDHRVTPSEIFAWHYQRATGRSPSKRQRAAAE